MEKRISQPAQGNSNLRILLFLILAVTLLVTAKHVAQKIAPSNEHAVIIAEIADHTYTETPTTRANDICARTYSREHVRGRQRDEDILKNAAMKAECVQGQNIPRPLINALPKNGILWLGGEFSGCGMNEISNLTCSVYNMNASTNPKSISAILLFMNNKYLTHYAESEMSPHTCNPASYGDARMVGIVVDGPALCGGMVDSPMQLWLENTTRRVEAVVRLSGPTIVPCPPTEQPLQWECTARDAGIYWLEVLVIRYGNERVNHLLYRGRLTITGEAKSLPTSSCTGDEIGGRWVYTNSTEVSDPYGYNDGYEWVPWTCRYTLTLGKRLQDKLTERRIRRIGFSGDSLGREMMSNTLIALQERAEFDGRAFKPDTEGKLTAGDSLELLWQSSPEKEKLDVFVYTPAVIMGMYSHFSPDVLARSVARDLDRLQAICKQQDTHLIYYVNPAVQHASLRLTSEQSQNITRSNVLSVIKRGRSHAVDIGVDILDGSAMTLARWYASHDGIHYTWHVGRGHGVNALNMPQWVGGVSWMITQILLNRIIYVATYNISLNNSGLP